MATTDPIRNFDDVRAMLDSCRESGDYRDYCLIGFGVYSALRIGDMLSRRWGDVFNFKTGRFASHLSLTEQKTGKTKVVCLNEHLVEMFGEYKSILEENGCTLKAESFIFASQKGINQAISRSQAWRIVKKFSGKMGIEGTIGCHSLRKTFGYAAYKMGASPALLMEIFNHSSFDITKRYLGIRQDDKDAVYTKVDFR